MPCIKCANGKWKFGERGNCTFDTLADCRKAEAAYYAEQSEGASMSESHGQNSNVLDSSQWRRDASTGGAATDVVLRKEFVSEVETDDETRTVKFTISTGSADREKDVINPTGWNVDHYLQNPVVLFAHDYDSLPVARTINLEQHDDRLVATAEFASAELNPMSEQVYQMLKQGFLRGASVGFRPMAFKFNEDRGGVDFDQQELLEFSVVPVPANPEALMSAGLKAENVSLIKAWAKQTLEQLDALDATTKQEASANKLIDALRKDLNEIKDISKRCIVGIDAYQNSLRSSDEAEVEADDTTRDGAGWSAYQQAVQRATVDGGEVDDGVVAAPAPVETSLATADRIDKTLAQINAALGQLGGAQPAPLETSDDDFFVELEESSHGEMIDLDNTVDVALTVRDALSQSVGTVVGSEVRSAINAMRGRIN